MKKACKKCKIITTEGKCPICGGNDFADNFKGKIIILKPEESEIAKKLKITKEGAYAVKT